MGCSRLWSTTWQYAFHASLCTRFCFVYNSPVHHRFWKGEGLDIGTCFSITLLRVSVKVLREISNSGMLRRKWGIGNLASRFHIFNEVRPVDFVPVVLQGWS